MISKKFGSGLILQVAIKLLATGLGLFTTRWLISNLSPDQYADYNLITSYNGVILMALTLGIPALIHKHFTNQSDHQKLQDFWTSMVVLRAGSYLLGLVLILVTFPLSQTQSLGLILGLFTAQFIILADLNFRSVCDAKGHAWQFSLTDFIGKFTLVCILYLGTYLGFGQQAFIIFIAGSILAYTLGLILDIIWQRPYTGLSKFQPKILKQNLKPILYLSLATLAISLYLNTDRLFLGYFGFEDEIINSYSNAYKLFEIASIIPTLTMPTVASLVKKRLDQNQISPIGQQINQFIPRLNQHPKQIILLEWSIASLGIGLLTALGLWIGSPLALLLIDPEGKYNLALQILPWLAISTIPLSLATLLGNLVIFSQGGEKFETITSILVAIFGLIAYILLIPNYGFIGASLATFGIYLVDMCLKGFFLQRLLFHQKLSATI